MHNANLLEDQPIAWTPTPDAIERSRLMHFMRQVGVNTWDGLYEFSIRDVEKFTEEVLRFLDIRFDPPYGKLLDTTDGIEYPKWLNGAGLNITTMCLDRWQTDEMKDQPAVIWEGEEGAPESITFASLYRRVLDCAAGLRGAGIRKGDAIGIHMPMMVETVVALLAIGRVGAIAVPVFSGYGVEAIASRLNAVGAKMLLTCDGFPRRGKIFDSLTVAEQAVKLCPTVERSVYVERINDIKRRQPENFYPWHILVNDVWTNWDTEEEFAVEPTSAEDPLIILYTSGTTGKPKGIAHTHASFPIKAAQDMAFGTDVGVGTRICWYTDIGWMMGPWLIYGALINGATICIYDGAPDYPTPDRMWEFCAKHKVEVLGISPTLIRSLAAAEERSADTLVRMSVASTRTGLDDPKSSIDTGGLAGGTGNADKSVRSPFAVSTETEPIEKRGWYRHRLPHFDGDVTQFITFRLADSLPKGTIDKLKYRLDHDKFTEYSDEYREMVEQHLDAGSGECILRNPAVAELLESTILHEHGKSCDLKAWVIMPNHAHVLLRPFHGHALADIMKRIKGVSAREINQLLGRKGTVWQADYFDRYIRDEDDFRRKIAYIENSPVTAGLVKEAGHWRFGSAWSADTPVRMSVASTRTDANDQTSSIDADGLAGGTGDADMSVRAPFERHDLSSLRIFASTGEPWNPAPWWWLFEKVGNSKLPIINYSGGTEIAGGILMGNPLLAIKPCSFPAPCPGMDVDILDEEGNPVESGKVGELVIKQPWIGMARGFWQEKERYFETYWRRFKDIWVHGDWAMRDKDGHWFILGRSDDTLKVAGKRVGPAEVESILVSHPLVTEAAVIGVPDETKGTAMVAFVVRSGDNLVPMSAASTRTGVIDSEPSSSGERVAKGAGDGDKSVPAPPAAPLEAELKALVAKDMGKPLAPSNVHFVSALPKTRNAKVMRRVIRAAYLGEDAGDLSALENPQAIEEIAQAGK